MLITIKEPDGSTSHTVSLHDIDRVETHTLSYFGKQAYNLYLYVKNGGGEHFLLFNYRCPCNMERAGKVLCSLLEKEHTGRVPAVEASVELFPQAAPAALL
ncbi:hypothetical protein [Pontibacter roseus]|uniref:hypothetical protein n=1 Tax=Pontibacter roseus TaxID=336989 RepID=UPI0003657501|nr:hypothetical protein [Pontibacter roseus]